MRLLALEFCSAIFFLLCGKNVKEEQKERGNIEPKGQRINGETFLWGHYLYIMIGGRKPPSILEKSRSLFVYVYICVYVCVLFLISFFY